MKNSTVRELFILSIRAEKEAHNLYSILTDRFSAIPEAREFFSSLASDEANHILGLARLRDSLSPGELDMPVPERALSFAEGFMNYSAEGIISEIRTLGNAYDKTINLEFSEVNKLHEFLFELNESDNEIVSELKSVLKTHLDKVLAFRNSGVDMGFTP
jgi:rubrerythrin